MTRLSLQPIPELFILWSIYTALTCLLAHFPLTDSVFLIKHGGQKIRRLSSKSARIAIRITFFTWCLISTQSSYNNCGLFVKLTYPLSLTTYQILMTKFDYSLLFYHQCNKSLVSLLLWFSFIFGPWYKEHYVKASLLKKLTGIHANNCYNFIYLFWTLTHPYNISSWGWTRNYSSMSPSVGRSRDDRYRIKVWQC